MGCPKFFQDNLLLSGYLETTQHCLAGQGAHNLWISLWIQAHNWGILILNLDKALDKITCTCASMGCKYAQSHPGDDMSEEQINETLKSKLIYSDYIKHSTKCLTIWCVTDQSWHLCILNTNHHGLFHVFRKLKFWFDTNIYNSSKCCSPNRISIIFTTCWHWVLVTQTSATQSIYNIPHIFPTCWHWTLVTHSWPSWDTGWQFHFQPTQPSLQ